MIRRASGRSRGAGSNDAGLSLIELLLASAFTAIVGVMALMWLFTVNRTETDFTAEQQAENDLRLIVDRVIGELADARPPLRCGDDPLPTGNQPCMTPVDSWEMGTGGSLHRASSQELCFYARLSDAAAPNPSNTSLPEHEVRCIKFQNQRLEVETAELTYDAQVTRTLLAEAGAGPQPRFHRFLLRLLPRRAPGLAGRVADKAHLDAQRRGPSLIKLTLMHSGVALRPNAAARGMSATVAVRANRFSPLQTPLFTKPGQVTSLVLTATEQTITLTWNAPSPGAGGAPTEYHVRWKSGDQSYPSGPSSDRYEVVTGATTLEITGLTTGTSYDVQVLASNVVGDGDWFERTIIATTTTTTTTTSTLPPTT